MNPRRVAITGLGLVSPYGGDLADFFARLAAGESAIRHLSTDDSPQPLSMPFVSCPGFDPDAALGKPLASMTDRFAQLGTAAAFAAWEDAGLPRAADGTSRDSWGVSWGTALGGTLAYEKGYRDLWQKGRDRLPPLTVVLGMNNAASAHISMQFGLGGVSMSHTVACASSAIAIGEAYRRVRSGEAPVMLTGGSDVPLWKRLFGFLPEPYRWLSDPNTSMFACVLPMVWAGSLLYRVTDAERANDASGATLSRVTGACGAGAHLWQDCADRLYRRRPPAVMYNGHRG